MNLSILNPDAMPNLPGAVCRNVDPDVFFSLENRRIDQVRNICRRCPEIRPCLAWALAHHEQGIWAGTTEMQRTDLLARHGRTAR